MIAAVDYAPADGYARPRGYRGLLSWNDSTPQELMAGVDAAFSSIATGRTYSPDEVQQSILKNFQQWSIR